MLPVEGGLSGCAPGQFRGFPVRFWEVYAGLGLGVILVASQPVWAARGRTPATVLSAVPSATGASVWARIQACGIKVQARSSWVDTALQDASNGSRMKGDVTVQVIADLPKPSGAPAIGVDAASYRDISMIWQIRAGKAIPQTGWADNLQNAKPPLQWMRC